MPVLDMPLDKLKTYQGITPRPDDFDAYWEAALAELDAVDPQVELEPAAFKAPHAECFHMTFTGTRGARIHAKYVRPKQLDGPAPAICEFHGYSGDSGEWASKLGFAGAGFCVASLDVRGQGGRSQDVGGVTGNTLNGHIIRGLIEGPEKLLYRDIFLDTAQLARIVMGLDEVDAERVGATGGSQGGGLTLACGALEPRVKRITPCFPFLSDYKRVWEMDLDQNAYRELREFFRRFDPTHEQIDEWFRRLAYIDVHHLAPRIKAETLMAITLLDNICPPSSQYAAYNAIKAPKNTVVYPDFGHEGLPSWGDRVFEFMLGL